MNFAIDTGDVERFDTTIGIPTNLREGYYSLQVVMLVGNAVKPYNSCGKLKITGGNPSFSCRSNKVLTTSKKCLKAGGPALTAISSGMQIESKLSSNCYLHFKGCLAFFRNIPKYNDDLESYNFEIDLFKPLPGDTCF